MRSIFSSDLQSIENILSEDHIATSNAFLNIINKMMLGDEIEFEYYRGTRGSSSGASVNISSSDIWACSNLVQLGYNVPYTIINLMPETYYFVIRCYSEDEENEGTMISNAVFATTDDGSNIKTIQSNYSINLSNEYVFKNTFAIFKITNDMVKYVSIHIRKFNRETGSSSTNIYEADLPYIKKAIRVFSSSPTFNPYYIDGNFNSNYGFIMAAGAIYIDTENKTMGINANQTGTFTFKAGNIMKNNVPIDISELNIAGHQTLYYDILDGTIKICGYSIYTTLKNVIYLGSKWASNSNYPYGIWYINTNASIYLNGKIHRYATTPNALSSIVGSVANFSNLKVLVAGDSICRGGRNESKGFIGDIDCKYVNIGIGGASISNVKDSTDGTDTPHPMGAANIPDSIIKYAEQSTEDWYIEPDAIIASGGINDYIFGGTLGTIPTTPIKTAEEDAALDLSTITGGLQHMFYNITKLFPFAYRFFLITNKRNTSPFTKNNKNYTQTDMHDAIVSVCELYGVTVIDVFKDSFLNTYYDEYVSPTPYREDHTVTNLYYCDNDRLHPLALGYLKCYSPLVKKALSTIV